MGERVISLVGLFVFLALIIFIFGSIVGDKESPTVNIGGNHTGNVPFTQDATAADAISGIATYAWTQISGPGTIDFGTPDAEDTVVSASTEGTYVIRLTVTDNAGNSASSDATIHYKSRNGSDSRSSGSSSIITTPKTTTTAPKNFAERRELNEESLWISSLFGLDEKNPKEITVKVNKEENQLNIFSDNGVAIAEIYFDPDGPINFYIPLGEFYNKNLDISSFSAPKSTIKILSGLFIESTKLFLDPANRFLRILFFFH